MRTRSAKHTGCGVDGLEEEHRYKLVLPRRSVMGLPWRLETKEDILVKSGSLDLKLMTLSLRESHKSQRH